MQSSISLPAETLRFIRNAAVCCIIGGLIATVGAVVTAILPSAVPENYVSAPYTPTAALFIQILWATSYALIVAGLVGVLRSGAVGSSMMGKIGLWVAIIGKSALAVGNLGYAFVATATMTDPIPAFLDSWMGMASLVTALGLTLAGIAVLHAQRWQGWHRWMPLICGLFVFLVLLPILSLEFIAYQWPIAGWGATFVLLGIALQQEAQHLTVGASPTADSERASQTAVQGVRPSGGSL